jgi:hypothetical protein
VTIGDDKASKCDLVPVPANGEEWRLYVLSTGKHYYAITIHATSDGMYLNGGFYEGIARSFRGRR